MQIGKIVKSNSHVDYVCQVHNPGETEYAPLPHDYAFGTFVRVELTGQPGYLVGLIYSTILMNPEFGNLGPRLSPASDLEVFSPDYLREQATLVGILAVGQVTSDGQTLQGVPLVAPESLAVRAAGIGISAREAFVAMDARRGEVYYAAYGIGDGGLERLLEPGVAAPEKAAADLAICLERAHGEVVLTGTAIDAYAHVWPQGLVVAASEPPGAGGLARLCREAAERGDIADPYELLPLYLRRPDVGRMGEEKRCAW